MPIVPAQYGVVLDVSIRARLCSRAMQPHEALHWSHASFNPRPALQPGDASSRIPARTNPPGFNPRPALQPGDARCRAAQAPSHRVSIRARLCSRAMPGFDCHQPAPYGRVSIRARLCSRAMPLANNALELRLRFQSAPGFAAGRCVRLRVSAMMHTTFQSAPGFAAGRCPSVCWYANTPKSFNPRPALQPGDAEKLTWHSHKALVSIRARLCSRAMRTQIVPRPAPAVFQSAPGFAAGRCIPFGVGFPRHASFNPRPALQPGDAQAVERAEAISGKVSIRARLCSRAMRSVYETYQEQTQFQSAPGFAAGRCNLTFSNWWGDDMFQSAPGFAAGRCGWLTTAVANNNKFQSAPGFAAGRCNIVTRIRRRAIGFQSAPGFAAGRCDQTTCRVWQVSGFNPRPALQPGDAPLRSRRVRA